MSIAAASGIVVMVALALSCVRDTRMRLGWGAWLLSAVALGPVLYAPYAPLATLRFEASTPTADAVALGAMVLTWAAAVVAVWRAARRVPDRVGAWLRGAVLVCGAVWIVLTAIGLRDESGATPGVTDSPLYLVHWLTACVAFVALTALAATRRPVSGEELASPAGPNPAGGSATA